MKPGFTPVTVLALTLGFAFLYLPILLLILFSFNESRLVTVWGGFSLKWYAELLNNELLLDAAWVTARIALVSATLALVLGTLAAITLVRFARFRGRTMFSGMIFAPLVMPEVITGLSLLLLFVGLNWERGFWTVVIAHTTFAMAYVAVVVQSRLLTFDVMLEEAAMDLGAPPLKTFFVVTLPVIAPALVSDGCWPSRSRSTISSLRASPRGRAPRRCRCGFTARSGSASPRRSTPSRPS